MGGGGGDRNPLDANMYNCPQNNVRELLVRTCKTFDVHQYVHNPMHCSRLFCSLNSSTDVSKGSACIECVIWIYFLMDPMLHLTVIKLKGVHTIIR